jgi:hypothetical protein
MQASELYQQLRPFTLLSHEKLLAPGYKSLHITPRSVRGYSPFGVMEVECNLGIAGEAHVDTSRFLQVLSTAPAGDFELRLENNKLEWHCADPGENRRYEMMGYFAVSSSSDIAIPALPWEGHGAMVPVEEPFSRGLQLAALGCGSQAYISLGLYGVVLENEDDGLYAYASDNNAIAACRLADPSADWADRITLAPDALGLLADVSRAKDTSLSITADSIYCQTPTTKLVIRRKADLKSDLRQIAAGIRGTARALPIDRESLTGFIRRIEALAEDRSKARMSIEVQEGATVLNYEDSISFSAEYYLVQSDEPFDIPPIQLEPRRIFTALGAADRVVFDYVDRHALVFRGPHDFLFGIQGKAL